MLKACWLVCPCSSVPALFPLLSACVGLLRSALSSSLSLYWFQLFYPLFCSADPGAETGKGDGTAAFLFPCFFLFSSLLFPSFSVLLSFFFFSFHSNEQKLFLFSAFYLYSLCSFFIFSAAPSFPSPITCLSVKMMREMAMKACYAG